MKTQTEKRINVENGRILNENGSGDFTLDVLSKKPKMQGFDIFNLVRKEEEIFEELLLNLEKDMKELINRISSGQDAPAEEFEMLFKQLHRLFKQKPYYLTLIFDKDFRWQYKDADKIISRIKGLAKEYIAELIHRGKAQKVFTIETETEILVKEILGSFQTLMNDMQVADKMVRDLKMYQSVAD